MPSVARFRRIIDASRSPLAFRYRTGDAPQARETRTRASAALYRDSAGLWQSAAIDTLRDAHFQYDTATGLWTRTTLREGAATNDLTFGRVLSNGAWTPTNVTVDPVAGINGGAGEASRLTATGANGTVLRTGALVHASMARAGSAFFRRVSGTGNIDITLDGGTTWTTVTLTNEYAQLWKTQTLANSQFGIRMVTSGDVIDVDADQNEAGAVPSSPIFTAAAAVTRAADLWSFPWSRVPEAGTWYIDAYDLMGEATGLTPSVSSITNSTVGAPRWLNYKTAGVYRSRYANAAVLASDSTAAAGASYGHRVELRPFLTISGTDVTVTIGQSINAAAEVVAVAGTARAIDAAYAEPARLYIGTQGPTTLPANLAILSILYVPQANYPQASFRALAGT